MFDRTLINETACLPAGFSKTIVRGTPARGPERHDNGVRGWQAGSLIFLKCDQTTGSLKVLSLQERGRLRVKPGETTLIKWLINTKSIMPLRPPSRLPAVRQGVSFSMVCEMACRQAGSLIFLK